MKHLVSFVTAWAATLVPLGGAEEEEVPQFHLEFSFPCEDILGRPGEVYTRDVACLLQTRCNPEGQPGPEAASQEGPAAGQPQDNVVDADYEVKE